jgi:long-subunit fatty acid transport protein
MIEFAVLGAIEKTSMGWRLAGACYHGPIKIGDRFTVAYRYNVKSRQNGEYESTKLQSRRIALRVEGIRAYQKALDELPSGMSGELLLRAEMEGDIASGEVISSE